MVEISKKIGHHGWPKRKKLKLYLLKRPKTVPRKRNLDEKINDSKSHIRSLSFNFRFFSSKSQSQQKLAKKITHFTIKFRSKNLTYFTNLTVTQNCKNFHFTNFPKFSSTNMFLAGVRKNICTAPFLDAQELHSRSTGKRRKLSNGGSLNNVLKAAHC